MLNFAILRPNLIEKVAKVLKIAREREKEKEKKKKKEEKLMEKASFLMLICDSTHTL